MVKFFLLIPLHSLNYIFELNDFLVLLLIERFLLLKGILKLNILLFEFVQFLFNHFLLNLRYENLYIGWDGINRLFLILTLLNCWYWSESRVDFRPGFNLDRWCSGEKIFKIVKTIRSYLFSWYLWFWIWWLCFE